MLTFQSKGKTPLKSQNLNKSPKKVPTIQHQTPYKFSAPTGKRTSKVPQRMGSTSDLAYTSPKKSPARPAPVPRFVAEDPVDVENQETPKKPSSRKASVTKKPESTPEPEQVIEQEEKDEAEPEEEPVEQVEEAEKPVENVEAPKKSAKSKVTCDEPSTTQQEEKEEQDEENVEQEDKEEKQEEEEVEKVGEEAMEVERPAAQNPFFDNVIDVLGQKLANEVRQAFTQSVKAAIGTASFNPNIVRIPQRSAYEIDKLTGIYVFIQEILTVFGASSLQYVKDILALYVHL